MPLKRVTIKFHDTNLPTIEQIRQALINHVDLEICVELMGSFFMISCSRFWSPVELTLDHKNKEIRLVSGKGILSLHPYLVWITGWILIKLGGECNGFNLPNYALIKWKDLKWWQSICILV